RTPGHTVRAEGHMSTGSTLTGYAFLLGYVVLVGVASFLQKFGMKQLNPYQINFLMAAGMLVTAVPALWFTQGSLKVPAKALPLGAPIGLLMALGSISYVLALSKLPVGTAAAISTSYVVLVVLLSRVFLGEPLSWLKIVGILLTAAGVALLSLEES
ncbi:MAG TPA: DMT family transporter, partial [Pyrinomonadaceae bacterium]|nr:DMT family transporter [Pyrinomonadaceae bacterium]